MGDQLRAGERTIRELVTFSDEEITDEVIQERVEEVLEQIEAVRKARAGYAKLAEKLVEVPKKDKKKYRRARVKLAAGAHRRVAADPRDRVHRDDQAPADRRGQGRGGRRVAGPARAGRASTAS